MRSKGRTFHRDKRSPQPKDEATSYLMSTIKGKDTEPELLLRRALREEGLLGYRLHSDVPGRPDIVYPKQKVAIFVHGCYWHRCPSCSLPIPRSNTEYWVAKLDRNVARDKRKAEELEASGWTVVVCWEHEVRKDLNTCVERVKGLLKKRVAD